MFIRSDSATIPPTPESPDAALCPPSYPSCAPSLSAGPALVDTDSSESSPALTTPYSPAATITSSAGAQPEAQVALAGSIQHIGKRNFVGIVVIAALVFVGLVLWLSFGKWPRAGARWFRARIQARRGGSDDASHAKGGEADLGGGEHSPRDDNIDAEARVKDAKGDGEADAGLRGAARPWSPLEVNSLDKYAEETPARTGLHVHFA
ncbi:hypothetical protein C2E23DRAFT_888032 [Lenzites betulinus]|nr:hypothetical protein C2E23DRAFT_888032 [Lenzites betulinus]